MNREQKAATIEALASEIESADAVFAVDYRGISVPQAAELRTKLRDADATFRVVKNSLTERAADQAGAQALKDLLQGPTALTFVRGDPAVAAKAIADYARVIQLLPFKGGLMDGDTLDAEQMRAISRLPSRAVLYGQLVGVVASPVTGLVRTLNALIGGLAVALGQVRDKKESGEIPAGEPPAAAEPAAEPAASAAAESADAAEPANAAETAETAEAADAAEPASSEAQTPADAGPGASPPSEELSEAATATDSPEPPPADDEPASAPEPVDAGPASGATAEAPDDGLAAEVVATEEVPPEEVEDSSVSDEAPAGEVASEAVEEPSPQPGAREQAEPEAAPDQNDNQADASA